MKWNKKKQKDRQKRIIKQVKEEGEKEQFSKEQLKRLERLDSYKNGEELLTYLIDREELCSILVSFNFKELSAEQFEEEKKKTQYYCSILNLSESEFASLKKNTQEYIHIEKYAIKMLNQLFGISIQELDPQSNTLSEQEKIWFTDTNKNIYFKSFYNAMQQENNAAVFCDVLNRWFSHNHLEWIKTEKTSKKDKR